MVLNVPKDVQIEALIRDPYELLESLAAHGEWPDYEDVFTVNRKNILEYVRSKYNFEDLSQIEGSFVRLHPSLMDGFYIIRHCFYYKVYYQERDIIMWEKIAFTIKQLYEIYVDYLVDYSGTGLDFDNGDVT